METLGILVDVVLHLYVFLMLLRLLIDPRQFHFSPRLEMIRRATDPILIPLERLMWNRTYAIFAAVALVVLVRGIVLGFIWPLGLISSVASVLMMQFWVPVLTPVMMSVQFVVDWLFDAVMVSLVLAALLEPYTTNPITLFAFRMVGLAERPLRPLGAKLTADWQRLLLIGAATIVAYTLVSTVLIELVALLSGSYASLAALLGRSFVSALLLLAKDGIGFFALCVTVSALLSWFSPDPQNPLVRFVRAVSEPIVAPFRRIIGPIGGIDISPVFAIILLWITRDVMVNFIGRMA